MRPCRRLSPAGHAPRSNEPRWTPEMAAWKMDAPQEMSPPRLSVCHPSWASDSLHMFVHMLELHSIPLLTLGKSYWGRYCLYWGRLHSAATTGNSGRGPSGMKLKCVMVSYMLYRACRQGERVLARVIGVGSSCRTGVLFSSCRSGVKSCRADKKHESMRLVPFESGEAKRQEQQVYEVCGAHPIVPSCTRAGWLGTLARTC